MSRGGERFRKYSNISIVLEGETTKLIFRPYHGKDEVEINVAAYSTDDRRL